MTDLTSVMFALQGVFERGESYPQALDKAYDRYNLSGKDKASVRGLLLSELRHHLMLTARVKEAFPRFVSSDEQLRLLALGLDLIQAVKNDESKVHERTELVRATSEALKLGLTDSDIETLKNLALSPLTIPEEINRDPLGQRSLIFNCPQWILQSYLDDLGPERTTELLTAQLKKPELYLAVNTYKAKAEDFENDSRFKVIESVNPNYKGGACIRASEASMASQVPEVLEGKLFAQDLSWFQFLDALPIPQYGKVLHTGGKSGVLAASLALRSLPVKAETTAAYAAGESLSRARGLFQRLGIEEPDRNYRGEIQNGDKPLCHSILSTTIMLKTELKFDDYDLVVDTPTNSHTGQAKRRPDAIATFNPDSLSPLVRLEEISILESSFFVNHRGYLAYAVPSILKVEGEEVVNWLLGQRPEFKLVTQKSLIPGKDYDADGLYYAILRRD